MDTIKRSGTQLNGNMIWKPVFIPIKTQKYSAKVNGIKVLRTENQ